MYNVDDPDDKTETKPSDDDYRSNCSKKRFHLVSFRMMYM
jgi:hypothetical protein